MVANGIHAIDLALISIIVISASKATGIVSGVVLSIFWLKEQFVWQFDVPAILLMTIGSVTMILQADRTSDNFTLEQLVAMVKSLKSIIYVSFTFIFMMLAAVSYVLLLENLS